MNSVWLQSAMQPLARNAEDGLLLRTKSPWRAVFPTTTPRQRPATRFEGPYRGVAGAILRKVTKHPDETTHRHDQMVEVIEDSATWSRNAKAMYEKSCLDRRARHHEDLLHIANVVDRLQKMIHHRIVIRDRFQEELKIAKEAYHQAELHRNKLQADVPEKHRRVEAQNVKELNHLVQCQREKLIRDDRTIKDKANFVHSAENAIEVEQACMARVGELSLMPEGLQVRPEPTLDYDHATHGYMPPTLQPISLLASTI